MQAAAAKFSGYAGKFRCFFAEKSFERLFQFVYSKTGSQVGAQRLLETFLTRNELVASVRRRPGGRRT